MLEHFIFIKFSSCSPEFDSRKIPLQLFFNKGSTSSYGSFLILSVATFQNLEVW